MNNIKIKTLFITSLFLIFFSGCSGLFNLTPDSSADDNNTFSIVLNNEASNRNITPYELTAERLSLVKEWKIKFTDLEGKTYAYTESSENGKITVKLPFIGNCSIEIEGSFTADGKTFSLKGSKSNVSVTAGSSVNINVEIIKNGTGTLNYKLKLDENTFGQIGTNENKLYVYFQKVDDYIYIDYESIKDLTFDENIEKDERFECFHAILSPLDGSEESITLSCNVFYKGWSTMEGRLGKKFEYFEISSQEQIPAGTYMLRVFAVEEKGTPVDITPFDNIVEIFGDTETVGTGISYDLDSKIGDLHYYVTKNQSSFNGFTPKSRTNFTALVKTLCNPMYTGKNIYLHFSEDEDISDYKDWEIWKEWKQNCHIYGLKGDYPASEQIFDGDDFYMGYYKTIFATYDATKAGSGTKVGVGPDRPIDANVTGYVSLFYKHGYTICYSDISTSDNYEAITDDLLGIKVDLINIILQTSNGYSNFENWNWSSESNYSLTLGSGIERCIITEDEDEEALHKLITVTLGDDFKYLYTNSFSYCTNLTQIKLGKNVTLIQANSFTGCNNLTSLEFPETTEIWYKDNDGNIEPATPGDLTIDSLKNMSSTVSLKRAAAPVYLGAPFGAWDGILADTYYKNLRISDSFGLYKGNSIEGDILDFTFDKHGNLYTVLVDNTDYIVNKYEYHSPTHEFGDGTQIRNNSNIQITSLYADGINNIIYMKQQNGNILKYFNNECKIISNASNVNKEFAISEEGYVYTFGISDRHISFTGQITNDEFKPSSGSTNIFGDGSPLSETENMKLTDIIALDHYVYVLVRQVASGFYSRGAVVRLIINEDGSLTYKDKLGWYNEKALNLDYEDDNNHQTETLESFKTKYFAGPEKFVAIKPDELVIADDGGYCYRDSQIRAGNINRIVTVDLDSFTINSSYDVNDEFNDEIAFGTNCSYIDDLIVR